MKYKRTNRKFNPKSDVQVNLKKLNPIENKIEDEDKKNYKQIIKSYLDQ